MGVWIETSGQYLSLNSDLSHPAWVCGLKQAFRPDFSDVGSSHPAWVCGLKQQAQE